MDAPAPPPLGQRDTFESTGRGECDEIIDLEKFGPIAQNRFGPRDGTGVELFYSIQVAPCLNVTPDVQFLRPGRHAIATDDAFVYGLRVNRKLQGKAQ
jgi:hypothetical protein